MKKAEKVKVVNMAEQSAFCGQCHLQFSKKNSPAVLCTNWNYWTHKVCTNLSSKDYEAAFKEKAKYKCPTCDRTSKGDLSYLGTLMPRLQTSLKCNVGKVGDCHRAKGRNPYSQGEN